jgi:hypothetical protein
MIKKVNLGIRNNSRRFFMKKINNGLMTFIGFFILLALFLPLAVFIGMGYIIKKIYDKKSKYWFEE